MTANEINKKLYSYYESQWNGIQSILEANEHLSYPLFMSLPENYIQAKIKILIVGQQPCNEDKRDPLNADPIQAIMDSYAKFNFGRNYYPSGKDYKSPFWDATRKIYKSLNPDRSDDGFAWSNLLCMDRNNKRVDPATEKQLLKFHLLTEEISITRPNVTIFFTGPNYDNCLKETFQGVQFKTISKGLDSLEHPELPPKSFRTYHPKYLRISKQWAILDKLVEIIG